MMGRHHAAFGAASFIAVNAAISPTGAAATHLQIAVGSAVAMGAALVPDIDEPGASAARSLGPAGRALSQVVANVSGGHRGFTHTIPCVALVALALTVTAGHPPAVAVTLGVLVALGLDILRWVKPEGIEWAAGAAVAGLASTIVHPGDVWPVVAVLVGWLSHMVGDSLTPHGVPWLWPVRPLKETVSLGWFHSGSLAEPLVTWVLIGGLLWMSTVLA